MTIRRFIYYFLPPLAWMAFIFFLSAQPRVLSTHSAVNDLLIYKTLHMIEYATLYFLWFRALHGSHMSTKRALFIGFLISFLYAISDEVHQTFSPHREGRPRDVLIDVIGMTIMYSYIRWGKKIPKILL